jgi:hypothetical protein
MMLWSWFWNSDSNVASELSVPRPFMAGQGSYAKK